MNRRLVAVLTLLYTAPASAAETLAVIAVGDPPAGPDPDLAELTHQLRAACRDRFGNVEDVPTMRTKLLGMSSNATLAELDRAYGGALAVYQNGEFESSIRTLRAIVGDLENLPEGDEAYMQWTRAILRLAHAAATIGGQREADEALVKLLMIDPAFQPDADQYSPSYRRHFDELRARVKARPRRKLSVISEGRPGRVFVGGRPFGNTPVTLSLPAGAYRVGGAAGSLRVPSLTVDLQDEDRTVALDFGLAESLRVNAGPGLALLPAQRGNGIIRAGAWLGADKLVIASRTTEGDANFLVGSIYDVRRGALLREGSVRMIAGSVPSVNLGALAAFLLTGQSSREVKDRTPEIREVTPQPVAAVDAPVTPAPAPAAARTPAAIAPAPAGPTAAGIAQAAPAASAPPTQSVPGAKASLPSGGASGTAAKGGALAALSTRGADSIPASTPTVGSATAGARGLPPSILAPGGATEPPPGPALHARPWMRPAAYASGALALGLAGFAIQQGVASSRAYSQARALIQPDQTFLSLADAERYRALDARAKSASRNAYWSAGAAAIFAAATGALGWWSFREPGPSAIQF